jgi:hypothetical protein
MNLKIEEDLKMKNKLLLSILVAIALLASISFVSAAVNVTSTFGDSTPLFGSSTQTASNPRADDHANYNVYATGNIALYNGGASSVTLTGITVTPENGFTASDINITLTSPNLVVPVNGTSTATLNARIPKSLDAVDSKGIVKAFEVAKITLNFNDGSSVQVPAYMQRMNELELKNIYVTSIEHDQKSYSDGSKVDKLKPGETVTVEGKVKNDFESSDNVQIDDITFYVKINDGDMDVDESADLSSIDAREDTSDSISFEIDKSTSSSTYTGTVYVIGEDENGAKHGMTWDVDWEVKRQSHEITFDKSTVMPDSVSCDRKITLQMRVTNSGNSNEDDVSIYARNSQLGINFKQEGISVDKEDSYSKLFDYTIPSDVKAGAYTIRFTTYYSGNENDGIQSDLKDVDVTVTNCAATTPVTTPVTTGNNDVVVVVKNDTTSTSAGQTTDNTAVTDNSDITTSTEGSSFTNSTTYTVLLVIAIIVVIIAAVGLILKFLIFA